MSQSVKNNSIWYYTGLWDVTVYYLAIRECVLQEKRLHVKTFKHYLKHSLLKIEVPYTLKFFCAEKKNLNPHKIFCCSYFFPFFSPLDLKVWCYQPKQRDYNVLCSTTDHFFLIVINPKRAPISTASTYPSARNKTILMMFVTILSVPSQNCFAFLYWTTDLFRA